MLLKQYMASFQSIGCLLMGSGGLHHHTTYHIETPLYSRRRNVPRYVQVYYHTSTIIILWSNLVNVGLVLGSPWFAVLSSGRLEVLSQYALRWLMKHFTLIWSGHVFTAIQPDPKVYSVDSGLCPNYIRACQIYTACVLSVTSCYTMD